MSNNYTVPESAICGNISVNEKGHLTFAGHDTSELAEKYGTPLYLIDEEKVRSNIRMFVRACKEYYGETSYPLFASKSLCCKRIYEILAEEGIGTDIVSPGELYTASCVNFPLEKAFFHGNNKTDADIHFAMDNNLGYFVVDNTEELDEIDNYAAKLGKKQKILLRLTPGIDPHTLKAISTGSVDSKFGCAIETGQAEEITLHALKLENIDLKGFHCHIGSQIFEPEPFIKAADIMLEFMADIKQKHGYVADILNLGGGFAVRYVNSDPQIDIEKLIAKIGEKIKDKLSALNYPKIAVLHEPGRSIIADAGMTLYTVGSVKEIKGFKNYVSIDGGMPDNPRFALYEAPYTITVANKALSPKTYKCSLAGRCCESGDMIAEGIYLQNSQRHDIVAVCTTGAYNYAMASNYNRVPRPPIVALTPDKDYIIVKRESFSDLVLNDC